MISAFTGGDGRHGGLLPRAGHIERVMKIIRTSATVNTSELPVTGIMYDGSVVPGEFPLKIG